jgi:hypothetical protein
LGSRTIRGRSQESEVWEKILVVVLGPVKTEVGKRTVSVNVAY